MDIWKSVRIIIINHSHFVLVLVKQPNSKPFLNQKEYISVCN